MRRVWSGAVAAAVTAACGGSAAAPTGPTILPPATPFTAFMCALPSVGRVHTIPVPGTAMPLSLWVESLTPAPGATVRPGEFYQVTYRRLGPSGVTSSVQVLVGDDTARGVFTSVSNGGCGAGAAGAPIPRSDRPLQLHVRVWLTPGEFRPGDPPPTNSRAPDYEATEPVLWTVIQ